MRTITFLTIATLITSVLLAPAAVAQSPLPVHIDYSDKHPDFGHDCWGIYLQGEYQNCFTPPVAVFGQGGYAAFGILTSSPPELDAPPVLVADEEGVFHVSVSAFEKENGAYKSTPVTDLDVTPLVGSVSQASGSGGSYTFTLGDDEVSGNTGFAVVTLTATSAGGSYPFSIASEAAATGGLEGEADVIQTLGAVTPVILLAPPAIPDEDGDMIADPVDNCPEVANTDQADNDFDQIGDACDEDNEDGPMGDADGDDFSNAVEAAAGTNPNDPEENPGKTAEAILAQITGVAADLEAFATAPDTYCADEDKAEDPKCMAYKTGGEAAELAGAIAADLVLFASDPAAYCAEGAETASDDKCEAYAVAAGAVAYLEATAADLAAFAGDAQTYCAAADKAEDPKCVVYAAGGDAAATVAGIAADLESFASDPDTYCDATPEDPKCQVYGGAGVVTETVDMVLGTVGELTGDLQAFATDPEGYCSDPEHADGELCTAYKAGGDAAGAVGEAAADLAAFADNPDAYCADPEHADGELCTAYLTGSGAAGEAAAAAEAAAELAGAIAADAGAFATDPDGYCRANPGDAKCIPGATVSMTDPDGDGEPGLSGSAATVIHDHEGNYVTTIGDNCPDKANPNQEDLDQDGLGDACDDDKDGDGWTATQESNSGSSDMDARSTPSDKDGDGYSNTQEANAGSDPEDAASVPGDLDGDGVGNDDDVCPGYDDNEDSDGDGTPDGCDADLVDGPAGDKDDDGVANAEDNCVDTANAEQLDADGDGIGDACDANDEDGPEGNLDDDSHLNADDNCPSLDNEDQVDSDGDGLGDVCDPDAQDGPEGDSDGDGFNNSAEAAAGSNATNHMSTPDDIDGDGIPNAEDICEGHDDDRDLDDDGTPDGCDDDIDDDGHNNTVEITAGSDTHDASSVPADRDGDGFPNTEESQRGSDPDDATSVPDDWDGDGVPNSEDPSPNDASQSKDADGDRVADNVDNCPMVVNGAQTDTDGDGRGDACDADADGDGVADTDSDGDGVPDTADNCDAFINPAQTDVDGDGIGDPCDADDTDGPFADPDRDGFSNQQEDLDMDGVVDDNESDPRDIKSIPADWDGDGVSNDDETAAGTDPRDPASFPADAERIDPAATLAKTTAATLKGSTVAAGDLVNVTLRFAAGSDAIGIQVLRANSPYKVIADLPADATEYVDVEAPSNSTYIVIAYRAVEEMAGDDPEGELGYLADIIAEGDYYEAKLPAVADGDRATVQNGGSAEEEVTMVVEVYDEFGNLIRTETRKVAVGPHSSETFAVDSVDTSEGASYNLYYRGGDGQNVPVASGVLVQPDEIDNNILWLIAGGIILLGIVALTIIGIVSYARSKNAPESA